METTTKDVASVLAKALPIKRLAGLINALMALENNDQATDDEWDIAFNLFLRLAELKPGAAQMAANEKAG